mmetsp:Transcript_33316/g.82544  ORF Transcript_33316/g.82544 Transcript_33316/m.82544 type:complete len:200 (+) Transcript_33316:191-790(+)
MLAAAAAAPGPPLLLLLMEEGGMLKRSVGRCDGVTCTSAGWPWPRGITLGFLGLLCGTAGGWCLCCTVIRCVSLWGLVDVASAPSSSLSSVSPSAPPSVSSMPVEGSCSSLAAVLLVLVVVGRLNERCGRLWESCSTLRLGSSYVYEGGASSSSGLLSMGTSARPAVSSPLARPLLPAVSGPVLDLCTPPSPIIVITPT